MFGSLKTSTALALVLLIATGTAFARAPDDIETAAKSYILAAGFMPQAIDSIDGAFDDLITADPTAMIPKDVDISPIEKAFLLLDTQETPLSRARYVLRYNQKTVDNVEVSFIDVQRYNLGPAIREETIAEYGAENTADAETFGVGPNVEWRFVTQQTAKLSALLLAASRREISDDEAEKTDCLPRTCLSLDPLDELTNWSDAMSSEKPMLDVAYPAITTPEFDDDSSEVAPAYQALRLAVAAGLATDDANGVSWTLPKRQGGDTDSPFLVLIVDRNLGQEVMSDAALGIAKMGLDSNEHWTRLSSGYFDGQIGESISTAQGPLILK